MAFVHAVGSSCRSPNPAEVQVSYQFECLTYTVTGRTAREINISMQRSPERAAFRGGDAGRVAWVYYEIIPIVHPTSYSRGCAVSNAEIRVKLQMVTPEFKTDEVPLSVRCSQVSEGLMAHEMGHVRRLEAAVAKLREEVSMMQPADNCEELHDRVQALRDEVDSALRVQEMVYDLATSHGLLTGSSFGSRLRPH